MPARPPAHPDSFDEAVSWFRSRLILTDGEFHELGDRAYGKAFTVARVSQLELVTQVWEAVDRAVAQGATLDDFREAVTDKLSAAWGKDEPWRVDSIYRTQVQRAYNAGRYSQMEHPAVKRARPYRMFSAVVDLRNRNCPICPPLDGVIRPADDPWWDKHLPPLHPNCRCHWTSLSEPEADDMGITESAPSVDAAKGFGSVPDDDANWQPDLNQYPEPLAAEYRAAG